MSDVDIIARYADTFFAETAKLLDELGAILLSNESAKSFSQADINGMFRIAHTLKGSFAMMDLKGLLALAHALEDILVMLKREGGSALDHAVLFDVLYDALDGMRKGLDDVARNGGEGMSFEELLGRIKALGENAAKKRALIIRLDSECTTENVRAFLIVSTLKGLCPSLDYSPRALDSDPDAARKIRQDGLYISFPEGCAALIEEALGKELFIESVTRADGIAPPCAQPPDAPPEVKTPVSGGGYVTVSLDKLEQLRNTVNELLLLQSKVMGEMEADMTNPDVIKLARLDERLQGAALSLRMIPVSSLFQKLHRAVHEAGKRLGRDIEFVARGANVEIDKGIIEALSESLVQIVRNAAVHGIEPPEERMEAGKPLMGRITVTARGFASSVAVTVSDDGRGISREKIVLAARKAGVEVGDGPVTDEELLGLLVKPGVTTSGEADEMSGRGVGLDVVNIAVEKLRGSLTLATEPGSGTTFSVRVAQSLAVMDCICLGVGQSVFLMPKLDVCTLLAENGANVISSADGRALLRFQDRSLPILRLCECYGIIGARAGDRGVFVIIEGEKSAAAVYAERLIGPVRAAIKPLPTLAEKLGARDKAISGCAVLNDGSIGLILDVQTLMAIAGE